jgi:glutamine synthetase
MTVEVCGGHDLGRIATGLPGFVDRFGVWTSEQHAAAETVLATVAEAELDVIRVGFTDPHGLVRSKSLTPRVFAAALRNGLDCSLGPFMFDTGLDLVLDPFRPGAGIGVAEMEGAADFLAVPDPLTFRVLPWAARTGWILADEYFKNGRPLPFSGRGLLNRQLARLAERGMRFVIGLEVEWYLTRLAGDAPDFDSVGSFGRPGAAPRVLPLNPGYQFNIESYNDAADDIIGPLRNYLLQLGLPLRTTEHESGPGQLEFTFDPLGALDAADSMILFRTAVKQVCARRGYHASFMCKPALGGCDASGWHLHQSVFDSAAGRNLFTSDDSSGNLSPLGRNFTGGLVRHAPEACVFSTPTVNGYRRYGTGHSLAPSVAGWSDDNRGAMIRVLAAPFDPSSHLENRVGEPAANPYLYIASQLICGLDGIDTGVDPGPASVDPHAQPGPALPGSLGEAIDLLDSSALFRLHAGRELVDLLIALKRNEVRRFELAREADPDGGVNGVSEWEQREYFRNY